MLIPNRLVIVVLTTIAIGNSTALAIQTIGGGTVDQPAIGPGPSNGVGAGGSYALVKNWDFGSGGDSTIGSTNELSTHFQYHDQFGTVANGTNYGSKIVAPSFSTALNGIDQPIEYLDTTQAVREFTPNSLKTYVVPLNGATTVHPTTEKAGNGSFQAKWVAENGGSRLGRDLIWETRVRYETAPYFWFALWTSGNKWGGDNGGAEIDLIESFGYDNGGGSTNYDGDYWHSSSVGGNNDENYHSGSWAEHMENRGIFNFDATAWHTWTLEYRADDTFSTYVDGIEVQSGDIEWTFGGTENGEPIDMSFIFDAGWGHELVTSVNNPLAASELANMYYEWDYSRIYFSIDGLAGDYNEDGTVDAADYTLWRDNVGAPAGTLGNDTDGGVIGQAQYNTWVQNFGMTAPSSLSVPEPTATTLLLASVLSCLATPMRRKRKSKQ